MEVGSGDWEDIPIIDDENQHFYKRYLSIIQYNRLASQCGLKPRPENKIETF